jgi:CheY-like chemotaxis protein
MVHKSSQVGIQDCLDEIQAPAYLVNEDYNVLWANEFCTKYYSDVLTRKCYQVFFGLEDVCQGCRLQECIGHLKLMTSIVTKSTSCGDVKCTVRYTPLISNGTLKGVLEVHYPMENLYNSDQIGIDEKQNLINTIESMNKKFDNLTEMIQNFTKAMLVPLRSFNGYFRVIEDNSNDLIRTQYMDILKMNSEILFETLNKMLLYTRFENGSFMGRKESFSLNRLINETVKQAIDHSDIRSTRFHLVLSETLPDVLYGDAYSLRLLFSYLLEFADYIADQELIEIRMTDIMQTHEKLTLKLTIHVTNSSKVKVKVLDYFDISQNSQFEKMDEYSFGLGLYLAGKIVEGLDGTIEMSVGSDGVFYVDVGLSYDKIVPQNIEVHHENNAMKNKILIADFEKPQLSLDIFKNYDIYFAHDGEDAINQYFKIEPDLTIVNVLIESCDGFKVYDEIERRRKQKTPIIAISNKLIDNEREFMRDYGFDEYYTKPLNDDKLNNIIENYL